MRLTVVGVGPGDPDLITLRAVRAIEEADLVLVPRARARARVNSQEPGVAERVVGEHIKGKEMVPIHFLMTLDTEARDSALREQLEALRPRWEGVRSVVLPVIGDSALYATGAYLFDVWSALEPSLEMVLVPGVSAHSLAASCAPRFLALGRDVLSIVPGTAPTDRVAAALAASDSVALYKPSALGSGLREVVERAGPWREMLRVDRAGLADQSIVSGSEALDAPDEYLSTLLLWR
ncbi:MAG: precorrin-2 C(20)-methyltransferase [Fretibacterium sp.]|nr:precorrin-2 C(20)-methyltransferase [Fretibacterium sp.]